MKKKAARKVTTKKAHHAAKSKPSSRKLAARHEVHYVCVGNCMGLATEKQYRNGSTKCNVIVCNQYGKPLAKMHYCPDCRMHYKPGLSHACVGPIGRI
jgi:hypothetical protein